MFGLGTQELLLILIIVLVLFGARKLPELGAGLAKGIRSFRKNMADDESKKPAADSKDKDKEV